MQHAKRLAWIGNPFFAPALPALGWDLSYHNPALGEVLDWQAIVAVAGGIPDVVVVADKSVAPFVTGMEHFPCLCFFYTVDTHVHSWFPLYATGFDGCLISLKDHISLFPGDFPSKDMLWWFPPYAHTNDHPPENTPEPVYDLLFVGTVDAEITPERHRFMQDLQHAFPGLVVTRGESRKLFPLARIVLNHAVDHDLNFRVFEALGCKACLLTPQIAHGLTELFTPDQDLFLYNQDSMPDLLERVHFLLANQELRQKAATSGYTKVNAKHRLEHRAQEFSDRVQKLFASGHAAHLITKRLRAAQHIHKDFLRLIYLLHADSVESPTLRNAYLQAAKQ